MGGRHGWAGGGREGVGGRHGWAGGGGRQWMGGGYTWWDSESSCEEIVLELSFQLQTSIDCCTSRVF